MRIKVLARKSNLDRARRLIREAKLKGAKAVVLPSLFTMGPVFSYYPPARLKFLLRNYAERVPGGNTLEYLSSIAIEENIYVIGGPIVERAGPKLFLTSFIISPSGNLVGKYRQIGISSVEEDVGISPGRELLALTMDKKYGLFAQEDLFYPEIIRGLMFMGVQVLLALPKLDLEPEKIKLILQARSIENGVPVISPGAMVESQGTIVTEVPTLAIDPAEGVVAELAEQGERVMVVEMPSGLGNKGLDSISKVTLASLCRMIKSQRF